MKLFKLPINNNLDITSLKILFNSDNETNNIFISDTVANYVNLTKEKIEENIQEWDFYKKFTNPYEFIHTTLNSAKMSVSKLRPISRAFYKLIEIYNIINLSKDGAINTFHLAEGPGGFIEATAFYRNNIKDTYYGITLVDEENTDIPGWSKTLSVLKKYPNINILHGADNTGNLFSVENFKDCTKKYCNSMDVITADGGFDFSIDFNKQEELAMRLILTEALYALVLQKYGGVFILKIFDTFSKPSIDIIYLLSCFYDNVMIVKPNTSRPANSEKYLICYGFKYHTTDFIFDKFNEILVELENNKSKTLKSILNIDYNYNFIKTVENFNAIFSTNQIDNIMFTVRLIYNREKKNEKIQNMKIKNVNNCIDWCKKNNIPHNNLTIVEEDHTNIFLQT